MVNSTSYHLFYLEVFAVIIIDDDFLAFVLFPLLFITFLEINKKMYLISCLIVVLMDNLSL